MENINSLNNECKKDKELFFTILRRIILAICVLLLLYVIYEIEKNNKNEVINAFKNNKELICDSLLVSIANGYVFEKNNEFIVSNGVNILNLKRCNLK
ncbi:hypothetical protein KO488_08040 [Poseidonibacter lekithochrous]|uniref:hypothetical protein n=1 Tax=Poseidonibacter TaxID=2321187 RepID=UPI001C081D2E|nr:MULTISPECIES: hypothetical protein [Poseidonibacter]MBU3014703.1 hypothetical protein [Poseidonibacter lekithochrous]MDO6828001.1 hypothetical protein [Poseidonibacter sp. 1_MG-2023]